MHVSTIQNDMLQILTMMKQHHVTTEPASVELRRDRLQRSIRLIRENHTELTQAMQADFGHRSAYQIGTADLVTTIKMLEDSIHHLEQWMQDDVVTTPDPEMRAKIQYQPLGVVGIISPWNFPINLSFGPLAGVFAAGNTAMLKPSELTPATSQLLAELVGRYFGPEELTVVLGESDVAQAFSGLPFDHLIFTGSTTVGKHVMRAAAENLVPVTLELGGKSPVMVAPDADLQKVVERTLTVKTFNAGQICLAPDYVLLPEAMIEAFIDTSKAVLPAMFDSIQENEDYTAIIHSRHYERLLDLLDDARQKGALIIHLGPEDEPAYDPVTRKIAPHLVMHVTDDMKMMQEEIFGPLLPVRTYQTESEALTYILDHPRPLAAYYFGENEDAQAAFAARTTSGALVINDVMTHAAIEALPFGGIGASGMGAYHGIHGFRRFSHAKAVVQQSEQGLSGLRLRAPYAEKQSILDAFFKD